MDLAGRMALFDAVLAKRRQVVSSPSMGVAPPPALDADTIANAVAEALGRFTDDEGALKVRMNNGGSPYGGG